MQFENRTEICGKFVYTSDPTATEEALKEAWNAERR